MNLNGPSPVFLGQIIDYTAEVGSVPAAVAAARADYEAIVKGTTDLYRPAHELHAAMLAAIKAGRDVTGDAKVQKIVTSQIIGQDAIVSQIRDQALMQYADTVGGAADALIEAWRPEFDRLTQEIRDAATVLGDRSLDEAKEVLNLGGYAAQAWVTANSATLALKTLTGKWNQLQAQTQFVPTSTQYAPLRFTDPTLEQWEDHELRERKLDAWTAHRLGLTLSLASPAEYMDRQTRLDQARARRQRDGFDKQHKSAGFAEFTERMRAAATA